MSKKKVIIIGAGFGGLSAAALLAHNGFDVTVLEKNEQPGGRAGLIEENGFRFDRGPSWYMLHEIYVDFFNKFNKSFDEYYRIKRLDPSYRIYFDNDDFVEVQATFEKNKKIFDLMEENGFSKAEKYLKDSKVKYDLAFKNFIFREYKTIFDMLNPKVIWNILKLRALDSWENHLRRFVSSKRLQQLLSWHTVFLGGTPYNLPSIYSLMAHVDFNLGTYAIEGGIFSLSKAFERLATENGAKIIYSEGVEKIVVEDGVAKNVITKNNKYDADIIISNADYYFTEMKLLEPEYRSYSENYWKSRKLSPSSFLIYLGLKKKLPGLRHHNYYFGKDIDEHMRNLFIDVKWPENPAYYVNIPSKSDPSCAPEGMENVFILVPVASGLKDSVEVKERYFEKIIGHFEKLTKTNIHENIIYKKIISISDQENLYNSYKGNSFGLAQTLFQTALFRPSHKSKKVRNLYFTGHASHPGIGMPMVVISSQIVAGEIISKYGK